MAQWSILWVYFSDTRNAACLAWLSQYKNHVDLRTISKTGGEKNRPVKNDTI